jgi:hypothetical protein
MNVEWTDVDVVETAILKKYEGEYGSGGILIEALLLENGKITKRLTTEEEFNTYGIK